MKETGRAAPARIAGLVLAAATLLLAGLLIYHCADVFITGTSPENRSETGVYIRDVYSRQLVAERLTSISWAFMLWLAAWVTAVVACAVSPDEKRGSPQMSAETRLALMRPRVADTAEMLAQRRERGLAGAISLAVCLACAGVVCLYLTDAAHFASRELEGVMGAMLLYTAPWIVLAFTTLFAFTQARDTSIKREIEAAKQAPRKTPEVLPVRKTLLIPTGRVILCLAAVALIIAGILNGGMYDVLVKAINICTECIGLG